MTSHTIGEVLNRLKAEFDDITISKIRFLEAEGLITPDRTESGYRQFTSGDVERLRYVLRAQRDRYLPLKVIKDELERIDAGIPLDAATPEPDGAEVRHLRASDDRRNRLLDSGMTDLQLSSGELADAAGLLPEQLRSLVDHGLLPDAPQYGGGSVQVARMAARLLDGNLESRHLRMFTQFADRHTALVQQVLLPLQRQRNPDARQQAVELAEELGEAGLELYRALLREKLLELLRS